MRKGDRIILFILILLLCCCAAFAACGNENEISQQDMRAAATVTRILYRMTGAFDSLPYVDNVSIEGEVLRAEVYCDLDEFDFNELSLPTTPLTVYESRDADARRLERAELTVDEPFTAFVRVTSGDVVLEYDLILLRRHFFDEWTVTLAPTCTEEGARVRTCSHCELLAEETVDPLGHDYSEWRIIRPVTCLEESERMRVCSRCEYEDREITPVPGHDLVHHDGKASCIEPGWAAYDTCNRCDYTTYQALPVSGHIPVTDPAREATCTAVGLSEGSHCSACGEVFIPQAIFPMLDHTFIETSRTLATCTNDGEIVRECSMCHSVAKEILPALGHSVVVDLMRAPTCTEVGYAQGSHCDRCGDILIEQALLPALGHDLVHHERKAPCTEIGWTAYDTCNRCDYTTYEELPIAGHVRVIDLAQAPTCTEDGCTEGAHCEACGEVLVPQTVIPATGHSFVEKGTPATCTEGGISVRECSVCGVTVREEQSALGHQYLNSVCTRCGAKKTEGLAYRSTDTGYVVTGIGSASGTAIYIPDRYEGRPVVAIDREAFSGCSSVKEIVVPSSVTSMGYAAFSGCSSLVDLTIPFVGNSVNNTSSTQYQYPLGYIFGTAGYTDSIAITQYYGYYSSDTNDTYRIPASLRSVTVTGGNILYGAFYGCSMLTSITLPSNLTSIGSLALRNCSGITSVTIPKTVTSIGDNAFGGCSYLATIEHSGTLFDWCAISNLKGLTSFGTETKTLYINGTKTEGDLTIPNGVATVPSYAFAGCNKVTKIVVPSSVTSIGYAAFKGCSSLVDLTIPFVGNSVNNTSSTQYQYPLGYIFGRDSYTDSIAITQYYGYYSSDTNDTYRIPASLRKVTVTGGNILYGAFYGCSMLTSITLPSNLTSIGSLALRNCSGITSVTIPKTVTSIGDNAFGGCSYLATIEHSGTLFDWCAISNLKGLTSFGTETKTLYINGAKIEGDLTIPNGVATVPSYAFAGCNKVTKIVVSGSVTSIGYAAFKGCSSLVDLTIPFVGNSVNNTSSTQYQYPLGYIFGRDSYTDSIAITQYYGYYSSDTNDTYRIPASLRKVTVTGGNILYGAFYGCSMLTSITLPSNLTSIGSLAFKNCSGITSVTIPKTVTSIGENAFSGCSYLATIEHSGTLFDWCAISNLKGLTSFGTESKTLYINGTKIEGDLTIPNGVATVPSYAFAGCNKVTKIVVSGSVTSIGYAAFKGCSSLVDLTIPFVGNSANNTSNTQYQYPLGYIFGRDSYTDSIVITQYYGYYSSDTNDTYRIPASLRSVTVTGGNILYGAFYNCSMLTSVTIGRGVTYIGTNAFCGCSGLTAVTFENPSGWSVGSTSVDVTNGTNNVNYLTNTYRKNVWQRA